MIKQQELIQSFGVLMENTPVECLQEALNHIIIFYNFLNNPDENSQALMNYHNKYKTSFREENITVFLCNESLIK